MRPTDTQLEALARFTSGPEGRVVKEMLSDELKTTVERLIRVTETPSIHAMQGRAAFLTEFLGLVDQAAEILRKKSGR